MATRTFERFAGAAAVTVGVGGLAYGVLFGWIVLGAPRSVALSWLTLGVLGSIFATPVTVALYYRLRDVDRGFALLALLLGLAAALGQFENSALALSRALSPELGGAAPDPAGVFRFGLLGVALFLIGWLIVRGGTLPRGLGYLGQVGGVLLVLIYLGRLTGVIDPATEITVLPPVLYGVVIHPWFYVWLGRGLLATPGPAG
ncbi:MAG: DUF4386 family protein [Actinomycetota bacterium]|nr:DUF4386 family protein [Actinomycetota bacterium]